MELIDYYKVLELPPSATLKEIKAAYRKLAHQYHPDKSSEDKYSLAQFNLIKEAYEVLTDPTRRDSYHQQRWYEQSINRKSATSPATPVTILKKALSLEKELARIDVYRMNPHEVWSSIEEVFSDHNIEILNHFEEEEINRVIVTHLSTCIRALPIEMSRKLSEKLKRIKTDTRSKSMVTIAESKAINARRMEKMHPWIIALIVVLLCVLIYSISK